MDMKTKKPRAAAIYCRISDDRAGEGLGVARQEALCRDLADGKRWPVAEVYVDNDLSAYSGKVRPAYERLLADLESGTRDAVLTVDLDRLTRAPSELERFISLADQHGVALANVSGDTDLSSSDGRFRARIMGAVARQESEKKSERIRRQRDQAAQLGTALGGPRPFGYEQDGMTIREEEATPLREAVKRVLAGESMRGVAMRWNEQGLRTARGKEWSTTSVRVVLTGPRIAGLRRHRGEVVGDAAWPAIITRTEHERLLALAGRRAGNRRGRPPAHLLTKVAVCGRCGTGLVTGYHGKGERLYICKKSPGEHRGCARLAIVAPALEELVRDVVLEALAGPGLAQALAAEDDGDTDHTEVTERIVELESRLEQLSRDHYADGILSRAEFLGAREAVQDRLEAARAELARSASSSVLSDLPADSEALRARWESEEAGNLEWKRTVLAAVLEDVTIHPSSGGARTFDSERVEFHWKV